MRKRWRVNGEALGVVAFVWFFAWFTIAFFTSHRVWRHNHWGHNPRLWVVLVWLAPYALALIGAVAYGLWCWVRSTNGWLIRREVEPVHEDLRVSCNCRPSLGLRGSFDRHGRRVANGNPRNCPVHGPRAT